ncbi:MAG: hypothetical protein E7470_06520 [Ruminococcaceae bacterium]|nr:hypothetical protein [Oscillospiraceae bacterium]
MEDVENKLNSILGDPQMMAKIMSMAQQLGGGMNAPPPPAPPPPPQPAEMPAGFDIGTISKLAGFANAAQIDKKEQALLCALGAYLPNERISKLEKAMRAAKLAGLASSLFGSGVFSQILR